MSTYLDLQQRIANDYLNRTDFGNEIKRAILAAVRYYERRRWRFNQTATALTTSAGQAFLSLPSDFLVLDSLQVTESGSRIRLEHVPLPELLDYRASSATGTPTHFTIYSDRIELFATPTTAQSCPLHYIHSLTELSADTDTNAWTNGVMQDVIVHCATKNLWASVLRNKDEALVHAELERTALLYATADFEQFNHGTIRSTEF